MRPVTEHRWWRRSRGPRWSSAGLAPNLLAAGRRYLRQARRDYRPPHLAVAGGALGCTALAGGWVAAQRSSLAGPLTGLCVVALACQALGLLVGSAAGTYTALAAIGAAYIGSQVGHHVQVVVPAALGTLLLASAELAWWASERSTRSTWPPGALRRRWGELGLLVGAGLALSLTAGVTGVWGLGRGAIVLAAGTVAALVLALLLAGYARRAGR